MCGVEEQTCGVARFARVAPQMTTLVPRENSVSSAKISILTKVWLA
jgi:hypothetical protein